MMLLDKINYEFKCFFLDLMRTSKENIFAHSAEIETKKKLLLQNNLLESAYCYIKDMNTESDADLKETVGKWKDFLIQENINTKGLRGVP